MTEPPDPALWENSEMRQALAGRYITTVYRLLGAAGISQRRIGDLTRTRQSEVCEIVKGRQVLSYDVLARICDGLGVPRGYMGLSYDEDTAVELAPYAEQSPAEEVDKHVKRRNYLTLTASIMFGVPIFGPAEALTRPGDVAALRAVTEQMRALGRAGHAGMPNVLSLVTANADRLLTVDADSDATARALRSALAELHTLAGWCCHDMHLIDHARYHYDQAVRLAAGAEDAIELVSAVRHAGITELDAGAPDSALKLFQLAEFKLAGVPGEGQAPALSTWLAVESALALATIGRSDDARQHLARAADSPPFTDPFQAADLSNVRAWIQLALGRVDIAEQYATTSLRTWDLDPDDRRDSVEARITLAETHVIAGERDAPKLTALALDAVSGLQSVRARAKLAPLEKALSARKDSTSVDLAHPGPPGPHTDAVSAG